MLLRDFSVVCSLVAQAEQYGYWADEIGIAWIKMNRFMFRFKIEDSNIIGIQKIALIFINKVLPLPVPKQRNFLET